METVWFEAITDKPVSTVISFRNPPDTKFEHPENNLAVCFTALDFVKVNPKRFHELPTRQRLILAAHEILHCQYGIGHKDDGLSVMNSYLPSEDVLEKNWFFFTQEIQDLVKGNAIYGLLKYREVIP
jgi:hypothetical protein